MKKLKKLFSKEVRIGIAGVVALFILIYGINYLKGIHLFKPTSYFYVNYEDISGLSVSSPVFADGYKIGLVRHIEYDYNRPGNITVEVEVEPQTRIPKGSWAELETSMLGDVKMHIMMANNPRESYRIGDTIPGKKSGGLMDAAARMMPQVEAMVPKLDSIITSLNKILSDENIPATMQSFKNVAQNLEGTTAQLNSMMHNDIPQLTGKLNIMSDNFVEISNKLKELDVNTTYANIDATLENVKLLTEKMNRKDNTIGLLLNDPAFYDNLNATANNAALLLEDLKSNPKRYVHFSVFGKKNK